jgi:hypothetical protein
VCHSGDVKMDDTDNILSATAIAAAIFLAKKRRKRRGRKFPIRPVFKLRKELGEFTNFFTEIKENDEEIFFKYTRMDKNTFGVLLSLVSPALTKSCKTTVVISPEERLALTLR